MPAKINGIDVTEELRPYQHGDEPQDTEVGPVSGSRDESQGPVQGVRVGAYNRDVDDMIARIFETDAADDQAREPEVDLPPEQPDESSISGEPPPSRRHIGPEFETTGQDTFLFAHHGEDDPQFGA